MIRRWLYGLKLKFMYDGKDVHKLGFFGCRMFFPKERVCTTMRDQIRSRGVYEAQTTQYILDQERFSRVVDVGANLGYYTILFRQMASFVISVEPLESCLPTLHMNIEENEGVGVGWIVKNVLGSENGTKTFYETSNTGGSTLFLNNAKRKNLNVVEAIARKVYKANNFIHGKIDLLKLDVEGSEYDILSVLNLKQIKIIIVEIEANKEKIYDLLNKTHKLERVCDGRNHVFVRV